MIKKFSALLVCISLLSGCAHFTADNKYSRCKELRRQMIYTNSNSNQMQGEFSNNLNTNNTMIAAQNGALQDNLNREYRDNGCE